MGSPSIKTPSRDDRGIHAMLIEADDEEATSLRTLDLNLKLVRTRKRQRRRTSTTLISKRSMRTGGAGLLTSFRKLSCVCPKKNQRKAAIDALIEVPCFGTRWGSCSPCLWPRLQRELGKIFQARAWPLAVPHPPSPLWLGFWFV